MSAENPASVKEALDKVNVTWTGECSHCRTLITFTGYRSADGLTVAASKLGTIADQRIPCPVCGEGSASVRCVGVALDPFAAVRDDEDDEDG